MSDSLIVWFAIALALFWSVGAYNRLMRLRSQSILAFATLESFFNQYVSLVKTHFEQADAVHFVPDPDRGDDEFVTAWAGLAAAAEQFNASLKVAHVQPLNGPTMSALKTAYETLHLSWVRLRDLPHDLAGSALPVALQSEWEHVAMQEKAARAEFNRLVASYNEGIEQFPAMWLAWVFGFKPALPL